MLGLYCEQDSLAGEISSTMRMLWARQQMKGGDDILQCRADLELCRLSSLPGDINAETADRNGTGSAGCAAQN